MLKYAKVINEETKQCEVGLGDPTEIFDEVEKVRTWQETERQEQAITDEQGNETTEIIDVPVEKSETYIETTTVGQFYESIGMTEQNVEQAYNGDWYLVGYAPKQSLEELKLAKRTEINKARDKARLEEYAEYNNDIFDIDETSQSNILAQIKVAELLQNDKATYVYRSKTNQSHLFNVHRLQELGLIIAQKVSEIYMRSWDLKAKIDTAETIEEVNAIEWYNPGKEVESAS